MKLDLDNLGKLGQLKAALSSDKPKAKSKVISLTDPELAHQKGRALDGVEQQHSTSPDVYEINLKKALPDISAALRLLKNELAEAKRRQFDVARVIHGYGSGGKGGVLKEQLHQEMRWMENEGKLTQYIPGEEFNSLNHTAIDLVNEFSYLKKDQDYLHDNPGVTLVEL